MNNLTKLVRKPPETIEYPDDVERLSNALLDRGYSASDLDIQWAWEQYSESMDAGWLYIGPDPGEGALIVLRYLTPETP